MALSSINRVILVGNLTRDPELRPTGSGSSVCHLRVACNGRQKDGDGWKDRAHYFDVSVFGPHGENAHKYLKKGRPVAVDGRLEWREWEQTTPTGSVKRQAVSIVADTVQFLGPPPEPKQEGPARESDLAVVESGPQVDTAPGVGEDLAVDEERPAMEPLAVGATADDPEDLTF